MVRFSLKIRNIPSFYISTIAVVAMPTMIAAAILILALNLALPILIRAFDSSRLLMEVDSFLIGLMAARFVFFLPVLSRGRRFFFVYSLSF